MDKCNPAVLIYFFFGRGRRWYITAIGLGVLPWFFVVVVFFFLIFIYLAALGLSCSIRDLVPRPGIEPRLPELGAQSLNYWTTSEVPFLFITPATDLMSFRCCKGPRKGFYLSVGCYFVRGRLARESVTVPS